MSFCRLSTAFRCWRYKLHWQMGALIDRAAVVSPPNARLGDESPVVALEWAER